MSVKHLILQSFFLCLRAGGRTLAFYRQTVIVLKLWNTRTFSGLLDTFDDLVGTYTPWLKNTQYVQYFLSKLDTLTADVSE